jgi:hypothetical protein
VRTSCIPGRPITTIQAGLRQETGSSTHSPGMLAGEGSGLWEAHASPFSLGLLVTPGAHLEGSCSFTLTRHVESVENVMAHSQTSILSVHRTFDRARGRHLIPLSHEFFFDVRDRYETVYLQPKAGPVMTDIP